MCFLCKKVHPREVHGSFLRHLEARLQRQNQLAFLNSPWFQVPLRHRQLHLELSKATFREIVKLFLDSKKFEDVLGKLTHPLPIFLTAITLLDRVVVFVFLCLNASVAATQEFDEPQNEVNYLFNKDSLQQS